MKMKYGANYGLKLSGLLLLYSFITVPACAQDGQEAKDKAFDGFYAGVEGGYQNIFGGALVGGRDLLAQDSKAIIGVLAGWRKQFGGGFVIGLESQWAWTDGQLNFTDPASSLTIDYDNNSQVGYGLTFGHVVGSQQKTLLYLYGYQTDRNFDVSIVGPAGTGTQRDRQGMIRYGIGFEHAVRDALHFRLNIGGVKVDFGDADTNIDVENKIDVTLGLVYQF